MSQVAIAQQSALIAYPKQAAFGRVLPKNKIYEHSGANNRLKNLFVEQVEQIVWQYKLAPETVNLPARPGVPEIQVFSIQLKTPELHEDVLSCIDGAVQFPILFELHQGQGDREQINTWRDARPCRVRRAPVRASARRVRQWQCRAC